MWKFYFDSFYYHFIFILFNTPTFLAQLVGVIEYTHTISSEVQAHPQMSVLLWLKTIRWWGSSNAWALGNVKPTFIAIALRSTLAGVVAPEKVLYMGQI